jgi:hypothetical protein
MGWLTHRLRRGPVGDPCHPASFRCHLGLRFQRAQSRGQGPSSLARTHRQSDPDIIAVYVVPRDDEVRIVEVSNSVGTTNEVIPLRFSKNPTENLQFDTVIVLMSNEEYIAYKNGDLDLPDGWVNLTEVELDE